MAPLPAVRSARTRNNDSRLGQIHQPLGLLPLVCRQCFASVLPAEQIAQPYIDGVR
jgi:hypothetical protein